jgi:hypothetical protein
MGRMKEKRREGTVALEVKNWAATWKIRDDFIGTPVPKTM